MTTFFTLSVLFLNAGTLQHVAKTAAHVDLSDHITNVVFVLFDENGQYLGTRFPITNVSCFLLFPCSRLVTHHIAAFSSIHSVAGLFSPLFSSSAFLSIFSDNRTILAVVLPNFLRPPFLCLDASLKSLTFRSDHVSSTFHLALYYSVYYASLSSSAGLMTEMSWVRATGTKISHIEGKCVTCRGLHNSEIKNKFCVSPRMGSFEYTYLRPKKTWQIRVDKCVYAWCAGMRDK